MMTSNTTGDYSMLCRDEVVFNIGQVYYDVVNGLMKGDFPLSQEAERSG